MQKGLRYYVIGGQYQEGIKVNKVNRTVAISGTSGHVSMVNVFTDAGQFQVTLPEVGQVLGPKLADNESAELVLEAVSAALKRQQELQTQQPAYA